MGRQAPWWLVTGGAADELPDLRVVALGGEKMTRTIVEAWAGAGMGDGIDGWEDGGGLNESRLERKVWGGGWVSIECVRCKRVRCEVRRVRGRLKGVDGQEGGWCRLANGRLVQAGEPTSLLRMGSAMRRGGVQGLAQVAPLPPATTHAGCAGASGKAWRRLASIKGRPAVALLWAGMRGP